MMTMYLRCIYYMHRYLKQRSISDVLTVCVRSRAMPSSSAFERSIATASITLNILLLVTMPNLLNGQKQRISPGILGVLLVDSTISRQEYYLQIAYLECIQTPKIKLFAKIVNGLKSLKNILSMFDLILNAPHVYEKIRKLEYSH